MARHPGDVQSARHSVALGAGLGHGHAMARHTPDLTTLPDVLAHAWDALDPAVCATGAKSGPETGAESGPKTSAETGLETRLASFATTAPDGTVALRHLVIRAADRRAAQIDLHTDARSAKVAQIVANPAAALLLWCPDATMQIRANGHAQVLTGDAVRAAWDNMQGAARLNYGTTPAPGTPIRAPGAFDRHAHRDRLAVLRQSVDALDVVILSDPQHRRAVYTGADGWAGRWVAP
ncbi:pyridoxamine 5'-phosphate oxidase family protein [Aliiroseovarius sp. PTFE2010]|uniref:pyridoxamine 5'-phosphate oxidase family protein n=1 Tax=Aliiroseovarius sp. PTFE2010 TaxID=3417190 RepID=UPI003CF03E61